MKDKPFMKPSDIRRGHKTQREKYGDGYSEEMARRQKLSHEAQLLKYGGEEGLSQEMARRSRKRKLKEERG